MDRRRVRREGFTMVELLVVIAIIALLAAFLLPVIAAATASARRARCSTQQKQYAIGIRSYLGAFDEYFPPGWVTHRPGSSDAVTERRFGYISYWRFLIHEYCEAGFSHLLMEDRGETVASKVTRDKLFWTDPGRGYTSEYFAPRIYNGLVNSDATIDSTTVVPADSKFEGHIASTQATQAVPATQLPVLTEVDVGFKVSDPPDWKGKSDTPTDSTHKTLLQAGWTLTTFPNGAASDDGCIGVGRATRDVGSDQVADESKKLFYRFDFRHNGSLNVLFLDSHVDMVSETNQARVQAIRDAWNSVTPTP